MNGIPMPTLRRSSRRRRNSRTPKQVKMLAERAQAKLPKQTPDFSTLKTEGSRLIADTLDRASTRAAAQAPVLKETGDQLRQKTSGLKETLVARSGETVSEGTKRLQEDIAPSVRELALEVATAAQELWEGAKSRTSEVAEHAQEDILPQAEKLATTSAEKAREASRTAADATVRTSRDSGSLLFWATAAGTVVYFGLLNDAQRARVRTVAIEVLTQSKQILDELRT